MRKIDINIILYKSTDFNFKIIFLNQLSQIYVIYINLRKIDINIILYKSTDFNFKIIFLNQLSQIYVIYINLRKIDMKYNIIQKYGF